jgi:hypothetical protein
MCFSMLVSTLSKSCIFSLNHIVGVGQYTTLFFNLLLRHSYVAFSLIYFYLALFHPSLNIFISCNRLLGEEQGRCVCVCACSPADCGIIFELFQSWHGTLYIRKLKISTMFFGFRLMMIIISMVL